MAQGLNLEPRQNALMRAQQMQGAQQQNALRAMQMQQLQQAMAAEAEQRKAQEAQRAQLAQALQAIPSPRLSPLGGNASPTPANAAKLGNDPRLQALYGLMQAGQVKPADYLSEAYPVQEVARTVEVDDGKGGKATVQLDKRGNIVGSQLPGYVPPVQVNQGDRVTFTKPQAGVSLPVGMSPEGRDASARGWASHNLSKQRFAWDQQTKEADNARSAAKPAGADKPPTEGERKAATLLTRLRGSQDQLARALVSNPGAAKPELFAESVRSFPFLGGDTPANVVTSEGRQQVEAAQLDMLDAALTLATGAAYTKEQLEGYRRSYFPQPLDDAATIADKKARLANVIQAAEIAAGRASKSSVRKFNPATGKIE